MKTFVDTNILVYAYDRGAGDKHLQARHAIRQLWEEGTGALSTQVLQAYYVNVRRNTRRPIKISSARSLVADYMAWDTVVNDGTSLLEAMDAQRAHKIACWHTLSTCPPPTTLHDVILSEDCSHGQKYGSVRIVNPFEVER